jgi:hypothetical protein
MEWFVAILLMVVIAIVAGLMWGSTALIVGSIARDLYRRGKSPWKDFDRDAARLHRLTHPEDDERP